MARGGADCRPRRVSAGLLADAVRHGRPPRQEIVCRTGYRRHDRYDAGVRCTARRNFQQGQFEDFEKLNGNTIKETRLVANKACFACTIACGRVTRLGDQADKFLVNMHPRNWRMAGEGPEYETAWALGADTGIGDLDAVIKAHLAVQ